MAEQYRCLGTDLARADPQRLVTARSIETFDVAARFLADRADERRARRLRGGGCEGRRGEWRTERQQCEEKGSAAMPRSPKMRVQPRSPSRDGAGGGGGGGGV